MGKGGGRKAVMEGGRGKEWKKIFKKNKKKKRGAIWFQIWSFPLAAKLFSKWREARELPARADSVWALSIPGSAFLLVRQLSPLAKAWYCCHREQCAYCAQRWQGRGRTPAAFKHVALPLVEVSLAQGLELSEAWITPEVHDVLTKNPGR